jgi:hypothetical protein
MPLKPSPAAIAILILLSTATAATAQLPDAQQIAAIRQQQGPAGVQEFIKQHGVRADRQPRPDLRAALDALCRQRDCYASQLYWHTDLEQAKAAAQASGKPILSLRLLGHLDDELSCANSRFFRVALYANPAIAQQLRDRFILHWSSERPVPKMTIDFGDGRKLERTVTGNSIHYVLDAQGQVIEALPGLYSPQAFSEQLNQIEAMFGRYGKVARWSTTDRRSSAQSAFLQTYHQDQLNQVQQRWASELQQTGLSTPPRLLAIKALDAATAGRIAMSKSQVELPILPLEAARTNQSALNQITDEAAWKKLAARIPSKLEANSLALMRTKLSPSAELNAAALQFQQNMAVDTARNEYLLHSQIHQWFMRPNMLPTLTALNQWVYSEIFLTPASDPWLGLKPDGAFAAIEADGLVP